MSAITATTDPAAPTPAGSGTDKRGHTAARARLADREPILAWLFLMPSVVYIVGLVAVPFGLAIAFSLTDVTAGDPSMDWAGLDNFTAAMGDPVFWKSLGNTFVFTGISMVLIVVFGRIMATILVADFRGKWLVRFCILLPWTTPVTLSSISWLWMLDSIYSPIDWIFRQVGLLGPGENTYWLGEPGLAMGSTIAIHVWRLTPLSAVILMAGIVAIPRELDEAARVDGAGYWRRAVEVTFPLTLPVIAVSALFGAIFTFTDMAVVRVLTRGGPTHSTEVLSSWAFTKGIEGGDVGQGAAIALFLFPLLLAVAVAILRSIRKLEV